MTDQRKSPISVLFNEHRNLAGLPMKTSWLLQLAGPAALLLLLMFYSFNGYLKEFINTAVTSVQSSPACPELNTTAVALPEPNGVKTSEEPQKTVPVDITQRTTSDDTPEPDLQRFVYIYDLGPKYTAKVLELNPPWYNYQYDGDKFITQVLMESDAIRTMDPDNATLFFVPFYAARFTLFHFNHIENNMPHAVNMTSMEWREILTRVRTDFLYFNRTNGRDHFSVLTMDHGRCSSFTFLPPSLYGDMFFLQINGDRLVRSNDVCGGRNIQTLGFNYGRPASPDFPSIPCYLAERDIVIPPCVAVQEGDVPPEGKNITALLRFSPLAHLQMFHHNHWIRKEIWELFENKNIPGWQFGEKWPWETVAEWRMANFVVAPPGHSQWTSRPSKALLSTTIPVTFTRSHDEAWEDEIEYEDIRVNIDPDDVSSLQEKLEEVMGEEGRMESMQRAIVSIKNKFLWTGRLEGGVEAEIVKRLRSRAQLLETRKQRRTVTKTEGRKRKGRRGKKRRKKRKTEGGENKPADSTEQEKVAGSVVDANPPIEEPTV